MPRGARGRSPRAAVRRAPLGARRRRGRRRRGFWRAVPGARGRRARIESGPRARSAPFERKAVSIEAESNHPILIHDGGQGASSARKIPGCIKGSLRFSFPARFLVGDLAIRPLGGPKCGSRSIVFLFPRIVRWTCRGTRGSPSISVNENYAVRRRSLIEASIPCVRSVFVGRDREIAELDAGLEDAVARRGRLFLLVGEPGVGKTRLADEIALRAHSRGIPTLWGRCWDGGDAPVYWPWSQVIRSYLAEYDTEGLPKRGGGTTPP